MATTVTTSTEGKVWGGGNEPMKASYGKMMMWFFIVSDALTFSGFLASYGFSRFKFIETWPLADEVFTHFPFMHGVPAPMYYVALMTFILIFSSVTMVLAVDAGHQMKKDKVAIYMFLTIVGGFIFVGSQAWEWKNFIKGEYGAIETKGGSILQFVDKDGKRVALHEFALQLPEERTQHTSNKGLWFVSESALTSVSVAEVVEGFKANQNLLIRSEKVNPETKQKIVLTREESLKRLEGAKSVVEGANLKQNEYGNKLFADFFFFITGFHGFHVFSGVIINIIIFFNVLLGTYERRGSYEMVEKVGLYWHFVDLVWVFVFTFFYLV
ncbi:MULTISPECIES: cytochrome c oxidase subunit 3 [Flavobacterium]|uniref:Cytochrome oxidase subunit III n=2 Tax=Flavobacterium TaxID=237 RepID=A0AA94F3P0_9FLAO|nr:MULTISPECIES: cytochrome c oxidase subunit 3 [Flavobacterium]OXA83069.1 cytochrome oxidase subunit III [Flavobacterium columnare NBRC 100251 = ATCC 23463]AMA50706.1 cytochrome oxidase subunit III [Flavobacterium covae]AND65544.1 cytochrome oxidase subunit III [Flavobacterium covae]MCH4829406.1 cytochrome c oxidase subunit 3 [Flavobacterium columnare]MCH4834183.1 cytochrome c oxidase subunit 3 [Flavobacterium columnare]